MPQAGGQAGWRGVFRRSSEQGWSGEGWSAGHGGRSGGDRATRGHTLTSHMYPGAMSKAIELLR